MLSDESEGFPEFTRFVNHGFPWKLPSDSHPLYQLSYRGMRLGT